MSSGPEGTAGERDEPFATFEQPRKRQPRRVAGLRIQKRLGRETHEAAVATLALRDQHHRAAADPGRVEAPA